MGRKTKNILSGLLGGIFLISTGLFLLFQLQFHRAGDSYAQAQSIARNRANPEPAQTAAPEAPEDPEPGWVPVIPREDPVLAELEAVSLSALREESSQVAGWIRIPDTPVDYPVMQGTDNDFYLTHTWLGEENPAGSIFLEWQNSPDFSQFHTILYGHSMTNGDMFGSLQKYRYQSHLEEHPYIYLLTDEGVLRYSVFSAYEASVDSDTYQIGMQQDRTKEAYIQMALENSVITGGPEPAVTDRILTLSTCSGFGYSNRWVVHGYLPMQWQE